MNNLTIKNLKQSYLIQATEETVWDVLTNSELIQKWTGAKCVMELKKGGKFSLWGGDILGKNLNIKPKSELIQSWKLKNWKTDTNVIFSLKKMQTNSTLLTLVHEKIPVEEFAGINQGWRDHYLYPIKQLSEEIQAKTT